MPQCKAVFISFKSNIILECNTIDCKPELLRDEIVRIDKTGCEKVVVVFNRGFKLDLEFPISELAIQSALDIILENSILEPFSQAS